MTTPLPEPGELDVEGHAQMSRRFLGHARIQLSGGDRIRLGRLLGLRRADRPPLAIIPRPGTAKHTTSND